MRCPSEVPFSACTQWRDCASPGSGSSGVTLQAAGGCGGWLFDRQCALLAVLVSISWEGSKQRPERRPDEPVLFIWPKRLCARHRLPVTAKAFWRNP